jgi:hypothetical protein
MHALCIMHCNNQHARPALASGALITHGRETIQQVAILPAVARELIATDSPTYIYIYVVSCCTVQYMVAGDQYVCTVRAIQSAC